MEYEEVKKLEKKVRRHQRLYDAGEAELSDDEFDRLVAKLRKAAPDSSVLEELGQPVTRTKVAHTSPMLSLEKSYTEEEVVAWAKKIGGHFVVAPKYDGTSLSLVYRNGILAHALTRGKGSVGDDVTANAIYAQNLPTELPASNALTVVRGEILFTLADWDAELRAHFEAKKREGSIANPRNAVAGTLLSKRCEKKTLRRMHFVAYDMLIENESGSLQERLGILRSFDFDTGKWEITSAQGLLSTLQGMRELYLQFETDGLVVKVDSFAQRRLLGATSHHPRWALALKFQGESGVTRLTDVLWQVSRTGAVSPVGVVDPVELSGATITRVTLHNLDQIKKLGLRLPSTVEITRRGGIIPHVERMIEPGVAAARIRPPDECPCCDHLLAHEGGFVRCINDACEDQLVGRIVYWCKTVGMLGWGEEVVKSLCNAEALASVSDVYTLTRGEAAVIVGTGLGPKLLRERDAHKILTPEVFLSACGIPGIGESQAQKILAYASVPVLLQWADDVNNGVLRRLGDRPDDAPPGFSAARWKEIALYLCDHLEEISAVYEFVTIKEQDVRNGPLAGLKFVFTGKLADMEREDAQESVRLLGASTPSGVTKDTNYLVVGSLAKDEQVTKREKAQKYIDKGAPIKIIDEGEFLMLLVQAQAEA